MHAHVLIASAHLDGTSQPKEAEAGSSLRTEPLDLKSGDCVDGTCGPVRTYRTRVVDNERYPAFFEIKGRRYRVQIERAEAPEEA